MLSSKKSYVVYLVVAIFGAGTYGGVFFDFMDPPDIPLEPMALWAFDDDGPTAGSNWKANKPLKASGTKIKGEEGRVQAFSIDGTGQNLRGESPIAGSLRSKEKWTRSISSNTPFWPTTQPLHPYKLVLSYKNTDGSYTEVTTRDITVTYTP